MNLRCPHRRIPLLFSVLLAACAAPQNKPPGETHLAQAAAPLPDTGIPTPIQPSLSVPKPKSSAKTETYSVVVNNVRVHDLLFALARDAKVNVDVHPGLQGSVTLNAIDQTLPQILDRLARQADLRWELDGQNLSVMPDTPFLQTYRVDYVNMKRDTTGAIQVSGEISGGASGTGTASSSSNGSSTKIDNSAKNHFWETLTQNIKDILHETDKVLPEGSSDTVVEQASQNASSLLAPNPAYPGGKAGSAQAPSGPAGNTTTVVKRATFREAASVIANPETGVLTVRATARQQEKIQQFLDQVLSSAKRQVLIEATIVEVELSNQYQQGVDWSRVASSATRNGLFFSQAGAPVSTSIIGSNSGLFTLTARGGGSDSGSFSSAIRLLEAFGNVKVLSSPKISAINNQSAILKVVDNQVYFNIKAETTTTANNVVTNFTTEQKVVPVGFVMNVTPQISESDEIFLNVRPSITRIQRFEEDPNPSLVSVNPVTGERTRIPNLVPVIRTREMESVLRLQDGSIAVMGGLMEEEVSNQDSGVPWFHSIPVFGALFAQKNREARKTELVIFLRPTVIREPSMGSDYERLRQHLPSAKFFENMPGPKYQILPAFPGPGGDKK
jgi:general secretion pathway protein D